MFDPEHVQTLLFATLFNNGTKRTAKEISGLQSEIAGLTERINLQADVTGAVEKECEALRSTVTS